MRAGLGGSKIERGVQAIGQTNLRWIYLSAATTS
jgi:hypothetical protein